MGVWMPLALADLFCALVNLTRMWAKNGDAIHLPERSETLKSWCLPMLASALEADEKERAAIALFESVRKMAGAKVTKEIK